MAAPMRVLGLAVVAMLPSLLAAREARVPAASTDARAPEAELAYWGGANEAAVAALDGTVSQTINDLDPYVSLSGGTLLGVRTKPNARSSAVGFGAATGAKLFAIPDAAFPLIAGDGSRVVFLPDRVGGGGPAERDPTINSVWFYDVGTGLDHRLVRFTDGDRTPLHLAITAKGRLVAITHGNDADLFAFDLYTARTDRHRVRRLTSDGRSLYPSFDPDGKRIAYVRRDPFRPCTGSIRVMGVDGTHDRLVAKGSCGRVLLRPVWLDAGTLVAWRWNQTGIVGLVRIDVAARSVSTIVTAEVVDYSVSRELGKLAFRTPNGAIRLYDIATEQISTVPGGTSLPGGRVFLSGALELAY